MPMFLLNFVGLKSTGASMHKWSAVINARVKNPSLPLFHGYSVLLLIYFRTKTINVVVHLLLKDYIFP